MSDKTTRRYSVMNKSQVITAWTNRQIARTPNGSLTSSSDGTLYSYNLPIGATVNNKRIVGDFTARGGNFHSMTTSHHVSNARQVAEVVTVAEFDKVYKGDKWYRA
jgi:hypothetical protein